MTGNFARDIINKVTFDYPKDHGRGVSAMRFARLREKRRQVRVHKVAELAVQHFITNGQIRVSGIVLAGAADVKTKLEDSGLLNSRLMAMIVKVVDVSYGGGRGFNQVQHT